MGKSVRKRKEGLSTVEVDGHPKMSILKKIKKGLKEAKAQREAERRAYLATLKKEKERVRRTRVELAKERARKRVNEQIKRLKTQGKKGVGAGNTLYKIAEGFTKSVGNVSVPSGGSNKGYSSGYQFTAPKSYYGYDILSGFGSAPSTRRRRKKRRKKKSSPRKSTGKQIIIKL